MVQVLKTDHVAIVTKDLEVSVPFYRDTLGLEFIYQGYLEAANINCARFRAPGDECIIELVQFVEDVPYNYADGFIEVIALKVADIFQAIEEMKAQGVEFLQPEPISPGPGEYFIFFRAPGGEKLELIQN